MKKILLSIKPKYVEEILAGRKLVEYRKRIPRDDNVKQVLIYASYPVKRIVAEFFWMAIWSGHQKIFGIRQVRLAAYQKRRF